MNFIFAIGIGAMYAFLLGSVPEGRAIEWTGHSVRPGRDDIRRHDAVRRGVADRLDEGSMVPAWYQIVANVAAIIGVALLKPSVAARRRKLTA